MDNRGDRSGRRYEGSLIQLWLHDVGNNAQGQFGLVPFEIHADLVSKFLTSHSTGYVITLGQCLDNNVSCDEAIGSSDENGLFFVGQYDDRLFMRFKDSKRILGSQLGYLLHLLLCLLIYKG